MPPHTQVDGNQQKQDAQEAKNKGSSRALPQRSVKSHRGDNRLVPEFLQIVAPAAGAYLATNVDNFVVLAAMLAQGAHDRKRVLAGFAISVLSALAISFLVALPADAVPTRYIGLLGVIPLAMGALGFLRLIAREDSHPTWFERPSGRSLVHVTALTLIANSGDTVVVLSALFADTRPEADPVIILSFITAAGLLAAVAAYAVSHPRLKQRILKLAPNLTPLILIAVGLYILADTATDLVSE